MKLTVAALALIASAAHAQLPANTLFVTENQNGGTIALYREPSCYTGVGAYSESPAQGLYAYGCMTGVDKTAVHVAWSTGDSRDYGYAGWKKVGE